MEDKTLAAKAVETPELTPEQEKARTLSEARMDRCEPVVKLILESLLKHNLLLSDKNYVLQKVQQSLQGVFQDIVVEHLEDVVKMLDDSLEAALKQAQNILWGKASHDVSVGDVEKVFKKARNSKKAK